MPRRVLGSQCFGDCCLSRVWSSQTGKFRQQCLQTWSLCIFAPFPRRHPRNPLHVPSSKRFYFNKFFFLQNGGENSAPVDGAEKAAMDVGAAWACRQRQRTSCFHLGLQEQSLVDQEHSRAIPGQNRALPKQALGLSANFLHGASCSQEAQSLSSCA